MSRSQVFFTFVGLLLAQLAVPFDLQFIVGRNVASPVMLVFGGLALGQLLYLLLRHRTSHALKLTHPVHLAAGLAALLAAYPLSVAAAPFVGVTVFILLGTAVARLYQTQALRATVRASAVAGFFVATTIPFTSALDTHYVKAAAIAALAAGAFFERTTRRQWLAGAAVFSAFCLYQPRLFPGVLRNSHGLTKYVYKGPTYFAPLLRTDIYLEENRNRPVIVTNGIHFAEIYGSGEGKIEPFLKNGFAKALVIGSAGGRRVQMLLQANFKEIVAVDLNPNAFKAMMEFDDPELSSTYKDPRVKMIVAEGRHFLHQPGGPFDLIYLEKVKLGEPVGGISPHFEDFLYTQEALAQMWSRLTDRGAIVIREKVEGRKYALNGGRLIDELARAVRCSSVLSGAHVLALSGDTRKMLPRGDALDTERGVLIISKIPVDAADLKESYSFLGTHERAADANEDCDTVLSDDRPFHSNQRSHLAFYRWSLWLLLAPALALFISRRKFGLSREDAFAFGSGFTYILWLVGITGLLFMFIENPAMISPVTLFVSFLTGLVCFHFPARHKYFPGALAGLVFVAAPLILALTAHKDYFLAQTGWPGTLAVLLLLAPGFILVETPYMTVLRRGRQTVRVLVFENWGCLVAIPLCYLVKVHLGFICISVFALFLAAVLCALLAAFPARASD